jgi:hypothetical protein
MFDIVALCGGWINPAALIQAMVVNVYEILGRLTDLPDVLKRDLYK